MVIALGFVEVCRVISPYRPVLGWGDVGILLLAIIFFAGSRDTLRKYYSRVEQLLGSRA
jgi:hypothetical protein